ncbi:MAG: PfkB family carbohydrate kinase [Lachnospiraceae bacterium]|nr:PfkB family carbohydrate kinase [Lachnospiraceae bacterium]
MARYLVTGSTIVNDMLYADGTRKTGFLGGTLYTVNGIRPYTDDLLFITTAGPDFDELYGDYYRKNGLSTAGVEIVLPRTQYNVVEYNAAGQWWEHSIYGEAFEKEIGLVPEVRAEYILKHADESVKGIYFESRVIEGVWKDLDAIRKAAPNACIQAELSTVDIDDPSLRDAVMALIDKIDMYSVNLPESMTLFGTCSEEESLEKIISLGKPCFFRVGEKGSYMVQDGRAWFAPSVGVGESVDATGCGNCSTGASLYGFCEGRHPLMTAILANLAAGVNASHFGPYPLYTEELRGKLFCQAEEMFTQLLEES